MLNVDPPAHRRLRAAAAPLVSAAQIQRCRAQVLAAAKHFASSAAARGQFDTIADYAAPIAAVSLATPLGVPSAELRTFTRLARAAAVNLDPLADDIVATRGRQAADELVDYFEAMIVQQRMVPGGGIAALVRPPASSPANRMVNPLTVPEALATLALVVIGGFDPLVHLIGNGLYTMLRTGNAADALRADAWSLPT